MGPLFFSYFLSETNDLIQVNAALYEFPCLISLKKYSSWPLVQTKIFEGCLKEWRLMTVEMPWYLQHVYLDNDVPISQSCNLVYC